MKAFNQYINEKLKINKNTKVNKYYDDNDVIDKILQLCSITDDSDKIYKDTIKSWVEDNDVTSFNAYTDYIVLQNYLDKSLLNKFIDDFDKVRKLCEKLIIDGLGTEVLGAKNSDPKIYYDEDTLIYHMYDKKNIDRVFIKKNE